MGDKILIVEDDGEIAKIIKEHLTRNGYEIQWSSSGREAIEDFRKGAFDLIILDIMLPEMDGFDVCKNIRLLSDIPIIILSAKESDFDKVRGLNIGANDYMTKPFSLVELGARVENHIKTYRKYKSIEKKGENILKISGGLCVDREKKRVFLNDNELELTQKEFLLLELMLQNEGRVFSKAELYQNIWGLDELDGNNTVTVHIKQLREKLKDDIKKPQFIQTVWGSGYRFIGETLK